jgi:hypothetical protein
VASPPVVQTATPGSQAGTVLCSRHRPKTRGKRDYAPAARSGDKFAQIIRSRLMPPPRAPSPRATPCAPRTPPARRSVGCKSGSALHRKPQTHCPVRAAIGAIRLSPIAPYATIANKPPTSLTSRQHRGRQDATTRQRRRHARPRHSRLRQAGLQRQTRPVIPEAEALAEAIGDPDASYSPASGFPRPLTLRGNDEGEGSAPICANISS